MKIGSTLAPQLYQILGQAALEVQKKQAPDTFAKVKGAHAAPAIEKTTFETIRESFPIADLSAIKGTGKVGDTFMLDGGSLQGLELQVRRVKDGDKPGFELFFKCTPTRLADLQAKAEAAGATKDSFVYRETKLGEDGIVSFGQNKLTVEPATTHVAANTNMSPMEAVRRLTGSGDSSIEIVSATASKAIRGLVRVQLRGTDAECTKQLQAFVKQLGMEAMFAPPTEKTKERLKLMRALWQQDQKTAEAMSAGGIDQIKLEDIKEKLRAVGFDDARIDALEWKEVYPGHFTSIDKKQVEVMQAAGARYLYSTVQQAEHVVSILKNGQQASTRRFQEGMIVTGMSSNTDFSSGGAVGVFTRLATQQSIWEAKPYQGRQFRVILKPEILARTDWYGWNGDFYGKSWDLDSKVNFGKELVEQIDNAHAPGNYASGNELIFRTGNSPEYIAYVTCNSQPEREKLITLLKNDGFVPPDGKTLEEFVRFDTVQFQFGEPKVDIADPAAFVQTALTENNLMHMRMVFMGDAFSPEQRARVQEHMLRSQDAKLRQAALKQIQSKGELAISTQTLKALFDENLPCKGELLSQNAMTLAMTDDDEIADALRAVWQKPDYNGYDACAKAIDALAAKHGAKPPSKMLALLIERGMPTLASQPQGDALLAKYDLIGQVNPFALIASAGFDAPWQLVGLVKQAKSFDAIAEWMPTLFASKAQWAPSLASQVHAKHGQFGPDKDVISMMASATPEMRNAVFGRHLQHWLKPGNEAFADTFGQHLQYVGLDVAKLKETFAGQWDNPLLRLGLKAMAPQLASNAYGQTTDLRTHIKDIPLYQPGPGFVDDALALNATDPKEAQLRLGWFMLQPGADVDAAIAKGFSTPSFSTVASAVLWLRQAEPTSPRLKDETIVEMGKHAGDYTRGNFVVALAGAQLFNSEHPRMAATLQTLMDSGCAQVYYLDPLTIVPQLSDAGLARYLKAYGAQIVGSNNNAYASLFLSRGIGARAMQSEQMVLQTIAVAASEAAQLQDMMRFLLADEKGQPDAAFVGRVIEYLAGRPSATQVQVIDAIIELVPASTKVALLQARKKATDAA